MKFSLFERKIGLRPTKLGWLLIFGLPLAVVTGWLLFGEKFLSSNRPVQANTLIVEGWIGREALMHAADEFRRGGYQYVVTTGCLTDDSWSDEHWCFADMAQKELVKGGVPPEKILVAGTRTVTAQRTFAQAVAGREILKAHGLKVTGINVFTFGTHGRRSRAIFSKVFHNAVPIGVISWMPENYRLSAWWTSSARAEDFVKETAGWLYEAAWSSGRANEE